MREMVYERCLQRLEKHSTREVLKGIDGYEIGTVRDFLEYLGAPQKALKTVIHIGGTSGKGSTAHFVSALLSGHGVKTGLFTSPHISTVRERICLNGEIIGEADFCRIVNGVIDSAEEFSEPDQRSNQRRDLTYFEILLASALLFFKEQEAEAGVIEVGLGGTLDPTNVLDGDIAILTNIGLDHVNVLGDTIEKIAMDKVGIIKKGAVCVSGFAQSSVVSILRKRIFEMEAKLLLLGKEFKVVNIRLRMLGEHQIENATLALEAFKVYCAKYGINFDEKKARGILYEVKASGRIEVKQQDPLIIWDAAHNEDKIDALVTTLLSYTSQDIYILFAFKRGQNFSKLLPHFSKLKKRIKRVILTNYKLKQDIELESEPVQNFLKDLQKTLPDSEIRFEPDAKAAYDDLKKHLPVNTMLVVTGSFYLLSFIN